MHTEYQDGEVEYLVREESIQMPPTVITVPQCADKSWLLPKLEEMGTPQKLPLALPRSGRRGQPIGEYFVGPLFILLQRQHPSVVGKFRADTVCCPECERPIRHPSGICLDCLKMGVALGPSTPTGMTPDSGNFGVKIIRSYWAHLHYRGLSATAKELLRGRNPLVEKHTLQMLRMVDPEVKE